MYWVARWTDEKSDRDMAAVFEAATRGDAEALARGRCIPYIFIARATQSDIAEAHGIGYAGEGDWSSQRHTCLGRPVGGFQLATLLLAGIATALLHLRPILPAIVS